jgi:4-hydroxy-tetrahydrodipicolinate synthase
MRAHMTDRSSERAAAVFDGIWLPLVTPFRHGAVDTGALQRLAFSGMQSGIHGLVVCGTTGEAATLDQREQRLAVEVAREATGGRIPLILGLAGNDTRAMVCQMARLNDYPVDGFLISSPAYVRPAQEGLIAHFQALSSVSAHPIVLYNIPVRTGVNLTPDTVEVLSGLTNVAGIKESAGDMAQMKQLIARGNLKVLCGDDALLLAALRGGASGAISAAAHIRPDLFVQMFDLVRAGRLEQASALFVRLLPLIEQLFSEPNPGPVKAALSLQGRIRNELRLPMTPVSEAGMEKLAQLLDELTGIPLYMSCPDIGGKGSVKWHRIAADGQSGSGSRFNEY